MSDFSMFSLFTAGLALFAPLSAAYTQPKGDSPKGNPISQPGLSSIVPAGKPFTVTWEPTTQGTVTLVLLKGPSENAEPQYAIAEKIDNDGSYVWTPKTDLEPTDTAEGYGIQLIVDSNGQYQYTTQFGISNPKYDAEDATTTSESEKPTVSPAAPKSSEAGSWAGHGSYGGHGNHGHGGWGHGGHNVHSGYTHPSMPSGTGSAHTSMTTSKSNSTSTHTGIWGTQNITMVAPTGGAPTKPAHTSANNAPTYGSGSPTNSTPSAPQATDNAAAGSSVVSIGGLVLAAGALMFAL